jgi:hypothetical protein
LQPEGKEVIYAKFQNYMSKTPLIRSISLIFAEIIEQENKCYNNSAYNLHIGAAATFTMHTST